jgi:hypothetical protein
MTALFNLLTHFLALVAAVHALNTQPSAQEIAAFLAEVSPQYLGSGALVQYSCYSREKSSRAVVLFFD